MCCTFPVHMYGVHVYVQKTLFQKRREFMYDGTRVRTKYTYVYHGTLVPYRYVYVWSTVHRAGPFTGHIPPEG
jgi:hypothetical protein